MPRRQSRRAVKRAKKRTRRLFKRSRRHTKGGVRRPLLQLKQLTAQLQDAAKWIRVRDPGSAFTLAHEQALTAIRNLDVPRLEHVLVRSKTGASHYGNGPASDELYGNLLLATATAMNHAQDAVEANMADAENSNNGLATYMAKRKAATDVPLETAARILSMLANTSFTAPMSAPLCDIWGTWIGQWKLDGASPAAIRRLLAAFDSVRRDGIDTTHLVHANSNVNAVRSLLATAKPERRRVLDKAAILANLNSKPRSNTATTASTSFSQSNSNNNTV
jgi:hypothetical protein